jgi:hypothetical protein
MYLAPSCSPTDAPRARPEARGTMQVRTVASCILKVRLAFGLQGKELEGLDNELMRTRLTDDELRRTTNP